MKLNDFSFYFFKTLSAACPFSFFSIGLTYIDVLITYRGYKAAPANSPDAQPLKKRVTVCFNIESSGYKDLV